MNNGTLTPGQRATLACLMEASAPKPGNVHRGADFEDLSFYDMAAAAVAIGPAMDRAASTPLGQTVLGAVTATHESIATNANLGTILLLAPLAAVPEEMPLADGLNDVLGNLTDDDACLVYEAIRLAQPGGMGRVAKHDLQGDPPGDLLEAMRAAARHDLVARQYINGFAEVLDFVLPRLAGGLSAHGWPLPSTIVHVQLQLLAEHPDSLIARKCGRETAERVTRMASRVLEVGFPGEAVYEKELADLDFFLRSDGHRRNPGTTADLLGAGLFAALREGLIEFPLPLRQPEFMTRGGERSGDD